MGQAEERERGGLSGWEVEMKVEDMQDFVLEWWLSDDLAPRAREKRRAIRYLSMTWMIGV